MAMDDEEKLLYGLFLNLARALCKIPSTLTLTGKMDAARFADALAPFPTQW